MSSESVHVVGICGSLNPTSRTRVALQHALNGAGDEGASTALLDLRNFELPFCAGKLSDEDASAGVMELRNALRPAQGIVLATPEYHGGMSGVLKNALDLTGWPEFEGKCIGLLGVAGGSVGAVNALNQLRIITRSLRAWALPGQVSIPRSFKAFDGDGNLSDADLQERVQHLGRDVARFSRLFAYAASGLCEANTRGIANPGA